MRVAVLGVQTPFARGGAEILREGLRREIAARGHAVDVVTLPFNDVDRTSLLGSCAAWRSLSLEELPDGPVELVVATKFPSYWLRHPRKVVWLVHQYRGIYDLAGTSYSSLSADRLPDAAVREALFDLDRRAFGECRRVFAISKTVAARLKDFCGIDSRVLYPPPRFAGRIGQRTDEGFVLAVGRLERNKRLDLLIEALALVHRPLRARIVGGGSQGPHLRFLAERFGVADRIDFLGEIDDEALLREYAACRAVWFAPLDEDYGYVTLEAFEARKPVVAATDSGGVLEFVEDEATGLVARPDPRAMAEALDRLAGDPGLARRLGEAGHERTRGIAWEGVVEALLEE